MSELGGLWKQQHNPECTKNVKCIRVIRFSVGHQRVLVVEIKRFTDRYQLLVATAVVTSGDRVPVACCQSVRMRSGAVQQHRHGSSCPATADQGTTKREDGKAAGLQSGTRVSEGQVD